MVMDLNKYKNDGWGISEIGFEKILEILNLIDFSKFEKYNILEFGSGISTEFFVDYIEKNKLKNVQITSFENDIQYMTKVKHDQLDLKMRKIITCSDSDYTQMFNLKQYDQYKFSELKKKPETRQKNCFYDIEENDLPNSIEFMLLDGPNGNGRNIAFLHIHKKLHKDTIVFIDDYNHYDFIEKFGTFYEYDKLFERPELHSFIMVKVI
jgi:hypothetical protein